MIKLLLKRNVQKMRIIEKLRLPMEGMEIASID